MLISRKAGTVMDSTSRGPVRIDVPADTGITNSIDQQGADDQQRSPPRAHITSRRNVNAQRVAAFLKGILVGGARPVTELEAKARAAGLLGDRHHIGDAKAFKSAKRRLGITSRRDGFGRGGGGPGNCPPCPTLRRRRLRARPVHRLLSGSRPSAIVTVPPISVLPPSRRGQIKADTHEKGPISAFDRVLLHKEKGEVRAICLTLFRFGKWQGSRNSKNATREQRPDWRQVPKPSKQHRQLPRTQRPRCARLDVRRQRKTPREARL